MVARAHYNLPRRYLNHGCDGECGGTTTRRVDCVTQTQRISTGILSLNVLTRTCEHEMAGIVAAELGHDVHGNLSALTFEQCVHIPTRKSLRRAVGRHTHALT